MPSLYIFGSCSMSFFWGTILLNNRHCDRICIRTSKGRILMSIVQEKQMDSYFHLSPDEIADKTKTSLDINKRLQNMSNKELSDVIQKFELQPIKRYLDKQANQLTAYNINNLKGFISYVDTYLIEKSGGDRNKLVILSKDIAGLNLKVSTSRLMRLQIINALFNSL